MYLDPDNYIPEHCTYCGKNTQHESTSEIGLCEKCASNDDVIADREMEIASAEAEMRFRANIEELIEEFN